MQIWEHLFLTGEFRARADLLSGLTLEQVALRPAGVSHSIYDELSYAATLYRLLDTTNYRKSFHQIIELLHALDCEVDVVVRDRRA